MSSPYLAQYTVWSRGRLLGHTDLGYVRCLPRHRMGDFHPTEEGESLMPIATGVSPAYRALHKVSMEIFGNAREERTEGEYAACQRALRRTTEYADVEEAHVHCESLRLELRGPNGAVIPTEWIAFQDTEYLLALA